MDDELLLAELLCARLCHDLAGPIGGASAGVELLADEDGAAAEDLQLLSASVTAAAAHLRFLRAALGHASGAMADAELRGLAAAFLPEGGQHRLDWQGETGGEWPRTWAKLALNLLMVARDALPRGGAVAVRLGRAPAGLHIEASGPALGPEDALKPLVVTGVGELNPRGAQVYYAARLAASMGLAVKVERLADRIVLAVEGA